MQAKEVSAMPEETLRKIDRRTVFTKNAIKDALLAAMGQKSFSEIGVTDVCRLAEINRGTFYLHYRNLTEVLSELFDDAMTGTRSVFEHLSLSCSDCASPGENSLCRAVRASGKYWPLFHDESVTDLLLARLALSCREDFVETLLAHSRLSRRQAETIYHFQINGCLAASRRMSISGQDDWSELQRALDAFIKGGLKAVCDNSVFKSEH